MSDTLLDPPLAEITAAARPGPAVTSVCPRLKVLIGAYACSPSNGSEDGVGWGWVEAISRYHDVWVLTSTYCQADIEAELVRRPELRSRLSFHYIPRKRSMWAEKIWAPAYLYTYKHQWLSAMYEVGKRLHQEIGFDIAHQLTYVGFRVPGLLWRINAPFVWGPIGGLEQTTWSLLPSLGMRGGLHFVARNLMNDWDKRFSRAPKRAFAKADGGIIAATTGIQKEIKRFYGYQSTVSSEIGLPPITRDAPVRRSSGEPLTLLWVGNHLPGKALPFLLSAVQRLPPIINWKLNIIGDGPCSADWQKLARAAGVSHRCTWFGKVPREAVLEQMQAAHVLVITSVYDLTSTVLVEALSNGVPVVCPDHCGFRDAITPECGIRVPALSELGLVLGLREAIVRLDDEVFRFRLAHGALTRSLNYDWDRKARAVSEIYYAKARTYKITGSNRTQHSVALP